MRSGSVWGYLGQAWALLASLVLKGKPHHNRSYMFQCAFSQHAVAPNCEDGKNNTPDWEFPREPASPPPQPARNVLPVDSESAHKIFRKIKSQLCESENRSIVKSHVQSLGLDLSPSFHYSQFLYLCLRISCDVVTREGAVRSRRWQLILLHYETSKKNVPMTNIFANVKLKMVYFRLTVPDLKIVSPKKKKKNSIHKNRVGKHKYVYWVGVGDKKSKRQRLSNSSLSPWRERGKILMEISHRGNNEMPLLW